MAVIEVQLGLPAETNKENCSNLTAEEEIILIEDILKCEDTLFGKMKGLKGGGIVKRKKSICKAIAATLNVDFKSNVGN